MSRAFNFSAGPAALPEPVLRQVQAELLEYKNERASVMELSHRGQAFIDCAAKAESDLRDLMGISDDYAALFLQGGATTLSALLPLNLSRPLHLSLRASRPSPFKSDPTILQFRLPTGAFRQVGEYQVQLHLHSDVDASITLIIAPE